MNLDEEFLPSWEALDLGAPPPEELVEQVRLVFSSSVSRAALEKLRDMVNEPMGPDVTANQLYYREGQRHLMKVLFNMRTK